jgi:hypothetical protein
LYLYFSRRRWITWSEKKVSEADKEEEVQQCKKKAKVSLDIDKENAAYSADGKVVEVTDEVADNDESESDNRKCFKWSGMRHDICCKRIGHIIKLCVKCEEQHKAGV